MGKKVSRIGVLAEVFAFGFSLYLLYHVVTRGPQIVDLSPFAPPWTASSSSLFTSTALRP